MSITISNCDQICQSPLNQSKCKMLYTFSKEQRFRKYKKLLCQQFYAPNFIQTARTTSFGFGQKYDFSKTTRTSPPCDFEPSKSEKKGFGFGKGRQQMEVTGPLVSAIKNKNPGPGSYEVPSTNEKCCFSFSGRKDEVNKEKNKIPGPGFYPISLSINKSGKYPVSKIKNVFARNFSTTIGRKQFIEMKAPAPGAYDLSKVSFSPEGKYALSKMQNTLTRRFGTSKRSSINEKKQTPGPGNYKLPSQFGHYTSKKFKDCFGQKGQKENIPIL